MDVKAAKLALIGLSYGADRIPDKFFEALPGHYFKTKEVPDKNKKGRRRERSHSFGQQAHSESNTNTSETDSHISGHHHRPHLDKMSRDHHSHSSEHRTYLKYPTTGEPVRRYDEHYEPEYQRGNQLVSFRCTLLPSRTHVFPAGTKL